MEYFDGLTFNMSGSSAHSTGTIRNTPRYYGIQFNYSGSMFLQIDHGPRFEVSGSYAFLTHPASFFEYGPAGDLPRHHNFICTCGPRISRFIESGLWAPDPDAPLIPIVHAEKFLRTMQEIMTLTHKPGPVVPRAVLLFEDLLLQLFEAEKAELRHIPYQSETLKKLIRRICEAPEQNWDFDAEAGILHITPIHFRRIFKETIGLPPQQFLIQTRLSRAAELLKTTSYAIKEIAAMSGWENVFYFSRLFRKKYYISPLQYRKEFHS